MEIIIMLTGLLICVGIHNCKIELRYRNTLLEKQNKILEKLTKEEKIKEMKAFLADKKAYPSCSFNMKLHEYNEIADILANNFTEMRVQVKNKEQMSYTERNDEYKGKWVVLTVSK